MDWNKEKVDRAKAVLAGLPRREFNGALAELSDLFGERVSRHSLQKAFARFGQGAPSGYCRRDAGVPVMGPGVSPSRQTKRIMVMPDAHVPYQDPLAYETFMAAAEALKPDVLVIIGDYADCLAVSSHSKSPDRRNLLKDEIDEVNRELDRIGRLGIPEVIYCEGNHEERMTRYLCNKAPELYGLVSMPELMRISQRGWQWVPYRQHIQIGKIYFSHEVGRCGKYTAAASMADFGHPIVVGHSHRAAIVYGGTVSGDARFGLNVGWLGRIDDIGYMHKSTALREWAHAFGLIDMTQDGIGWAHLVRIIEGRCVIDGRVISGRKAAA